jgi:hypothetical protein
MKKLLLSSVLVVTLTLAFTAASSLAQTCGGCGGGKKKDTSTNAPSTNSTAIVHVAL